MEDACGRSTDCARCVPAQTIRDQPFGIEQPDGIFLSQWLTCSVREEIIHRDQLQKRPQLFAAVYRVQNNRRLPGNPPVIFGIECGRAAPAVSRILR